MKEITELVFIIDRSGSMAGLEADTIGGFNAMLAKQKKEKGEVLVSTVLFSDGSQVIHDRKKIQNVSPMNEKMYQVGGCTALLDAIGGAIHHIRNVHRYIRKEDVPAHTMFVITTDGMENASHQYSYDDVRHMIAMQKKRYGWEFLFLGANMDAIKAARSFGISKERAVRYHNDAQGTALNYDVVSETICQYRSVGTIQDNWKARIEEDYESRS